MGSEAWVSQDAIVDLPAWLQSLTSAVGRLRTQDLTMFLPPAEGGRAGAVLILFGEGEDGPDVLLTERAALMRSHAGQPAFPGGAVDTGDADAIAAALREAREETGLEPSGVSVFGALPDLWLPPSGFVVTPVLAWWAQPSQVHVAEPAEVAAVHRVPISTLVNPANRVEVTHPSGYVGPGFDTHGMLIWGFTAGVLSNLMDIAGWSKPWEPTRRVNIDDLL